MADTSGQCDICDSTVSSPAGYLLTTKDIVSEPRYWRHYYQYHKGEFDIMGVSSYEAFCRNQSLRSMICVTVASQRTPWLVCEKCISLFNVDQGRARNHAEQWWRSGRAFQPPGTGPAPVPAIKMEG